ncbi:AAA-domain-containing protein [Punctularia strigosozonata HHB-11173 SS5]|uniref:AAA-domain-containing protein n=1 Tax=Punctularia strigosozonata (strain HHB-11173) TaxID=741275 RepID=UPI0004418254|nr:AAA-domain-containing protein [Punctularia strigosozonata HHB-11173 SS5]EIN12173.1 AAA-domain-containing protein [Punctularia strigosozonata HHB-11173 SS5]
MWSSWMMVGSNVELGAGCATRPAPRSPPASTTSGSLARRSAIPGTPRTMAISAQTKRTIVDVALFLASQAALYYTVRWVLYPSADVPKVKAKNLDLLKSRGNGKLKLDEHEKIIAAEVIHPDDINVRFSDIGGLDPIISSLRESIIYPLLYPHLFPTTSLLSAPKGVLLFGPPGCGKTMLARALAKESSATFINVAASTLSSKWYGESNKLVAALFALARKTQPAIIFIDEIDSFLRERSRGDHEVTGMVKAEFMTLWDGLTSATDRIVVLGATNRPGDIDAAFLRRMPKRFGINLPDADQREKILRLMLHDTPLAPSLSLRALAERAEGLSGSDLKELCRAAAMIAVRERMAALEAELTSHPHDAPSSFAPTHPAYFEDAKAAHHNDSKGAGASDEAIRAALARDGAAESFAALRPLTMDDFVRAGEQFLATMSSGGTNASALHSGGGVDDVDDVPAAADRSGASAYVDAEDRSRIDDVPGEELQAEEKEHVLD